MKFLLVLSHVSEVFLTSTYNRPVAHSWNTQTVAGGGIFKQLIVFIHKLFQLFKIIKLSARHGFCV